ncbi:MAG: magnesium transporter, partial [Patescibacteria group bacterium]
NFKIYLIKETLAGVILGIASSLPTAIITAVWLASTKITLAVSLAMFGAIAIAPLVALLTTEIFQLKHKDPAVGAGPLATAIQDTLSVLIYGIITSSIIL